jgi:hypothetical protein
MTIGLNDKMKAQLVVPKEKPIGFSLGDGQDNVQKLEVLTRTIRTTRKLSCQHLGLS